MNTVGTPLLWGGFAVVVAIMLAIDLLLQGRRGAHAMTMKQAAAWSLVWVTLSLLFNAAFWWYLVQTEGRAVADPQALAFLTGYLIEKSLAVDNVFVWLMLFSYFSVPAALQRRVLVYGVLGAIVRIANRFEVSTINGSVVTAKIAGMLSTAKITSLNSTRISTSISDVGRFFMCKELL